MHRRPRRVADPDRHRVAGGIADTPVVAHVLAGAGLGCAPVGRRQPRFEPEGADPRRLVAENIGHNEGRRGRRHASRLAIEHAQAAAVAARRGRFCDAQRRPHAAVGQGAIGVGQHQRRNVGRAEREAVAVIIAVFRQTPEAQRHQPIAKIRRTEPHQRAHCRHVERAAKRGTHADPTAVIRTVVLRHIEAAPRGDGQRRIVKQRGRRQRVALEGQRVEKGLERRAGLAQRRDAVNLGRGRQDAAGTDPGEYLAGGIVEHQHRAVFGILTDDLAQMPLQGIAGKALKIGIQRAAQAFAGLLEQLLRQMWREARRLLRTEPAALDVAQAAGQCQSRQPFQPTAIGGRAFLHLRRHLPDAAGTLRHHLRRSARRPQQGRCQRRFARIQPVRPLAEQTAAHCRHTDQLAAKAGEVQVGLENLVFLPALFQPQCPGRLREFLRHTAPAFAPGVLVGELVEQADELHGERAGTARFRIPQIAPGTDRRRAPVDAGMFVETPVFRSQQGTQ